MAKGRWTLSAESITAVAAVIAALIALGVGVWENAQERKHNRLSVFPSLEFVAMLEHSDTAREVRGVIRVINEGVGPAVIDDIRIRVGRPGGTSRTFGAWTEAEPALREIGFNLTGRAELGEGSVMGVGRERDLAVFTFPGTREGGEALERFDALLGALVVTITYRSIYADQYESVLGDG